MEVRAGYKQTEVGVIPEDWGCPSIAEIAAKRPNAIVGGPFGSDLVSKDYVDTGVPVVRGQNMAQQYVSGDFVFVSRSKAKQLQANIARADDVIFTQRGTLGQVSIVPRGPFMEYLVSQSQMKLTLNSDVANCFYVYQYLVSGNGLRQILDSAIQTGVPHTNLGILRSYKIPLPPTKAEQEAIAEALSDADALIESLEQLIAKKRRIKQGAMQELLTGKRRLPGFSGEWEVKRLGSVCHITTGKKDVNEGNPDGQYPFFTCSRSYTFSDIYSFDAEAILIAGNGDVGNLHYFKGKFEAYQRTYVLLGFSTNVSFLWQQLSAYLAASLGLGKIGSSIPYIKKENLVNFEFSSPVDEAEQTAIATVLSDMDAELAALEEKLAKARQVKQGMMQELLTGRIRLI